MGHFWYAELTMRDEPNIGLKCSSVRSSETIKVLVHLNSRTVVVEVEIRQGVCNNSLAEWTGTENGWRSSV